MEEYETQTDIDSSSDSDGGKYIEKIKKRRRESGLIRKMVLGNAIEKFSDSVRDYKKSTSNRKPRKSKDKSVINFNFVRRSDRLHGLLPSEISCDDYLSDIDEDRRGQKRKRCLSEDSDEEHPRRRMCVRVSHIERFFVEPNNVTPEIKNNIALRVSDKVYDQNNGFTCHQCRQKTRDTKSVCRSKNCTGVRGQFCGVCLRNHYGEDLAEILEKDDWLCPYCRGICHCSFCRKSKGLQPLGIIYNHIKNDGYKSVHDYLEKERKNNADSDSNENTMSLKECQLLVYRLEDELIPYFDDRSYESNDEDTAHGPFLGYHIGSPPDYISMAVLRSTLESLDSSLRKKFLMENIPMARCTELMRYLPDDLRNEVMQDLPENAHYQLW